MNRRLLLLACAVLTLLFASTPDKGRAQTAPSNKAAPATKTPGPFDDLSSDTWPYVAVDILQKAGIMVGYPEGTYGGKRGMSRYEFAVMVARMLPILAPAKAPPVGNSDMNALHGQMQAKFEQNPLALNAMLALMDEFQPELVRLDQTDPAKGNPLGAARQQLKIWKSHQETDGKSFALTPAQARDPFADVPLDHWAYSALESLRNKGIVIGYPDGTYHARQILTRLQLATEVACLLPPQPAPVGAPARWSGLRPLSLPAVNLTELLTHSPEAVTAMTVLIKEFTLELQLLGRDVPAAQTRLATLRTASFGDVGGKHWASHSIEMLRLNGILVGYPDGAFQTSDDHD